MAQSRHDASDRTRVRRGPTRGRYDRASIDDILSRGLVAHVAFFDGQDQCCIPMLYAYVEDKIYIHGSTASRAMPGPSRWRRGVRDGHLVHGLVLARSAYEHSANYEA